MYVNNRKHFRFKSLTFSAVRASSHQHEYSTASSTAADWQPPCQHNNIQNRYKIYVKYACQIYHNENEEKMMSIKVRPTNSDPPEYTLKTCCGLNSTGLRMFCLDLVKLFVIYFFHNTIFSANNIASN